MYYKYLNYRKNFWAEEAFKYESLKIGAILYDPNSSYISLVYPTDLFRINYYYDEINTFLLEVFLAAFNKEVMSLNDKDGSVGRTEDKDLFIKYLNTFLKNDFYFDEEWIIENKIDKHFIGKFTNVYDLIPL